MGNDLQPGNTKFRLMIDSSLETYRHTKTKKDKSTVVNRIIGIVRSASQGGRFVRKHSDGKWYETGDDFAREKIGQW
jgi:hypothetical protein